MRKISFIAIVSAIIALYSLFITGCQPKEVSTVDPELQSLIKSTGGSKQYVPEQIKKALSSGTPLALFFYDPNDQISSQVVKYFDGEEKNNPAVEFVKVNVTDKKMSFLMAKFDVGFIPETLILDGSGNVVMRKNGWIDKKTLIAGIAAATGIEPDTESAGSL